jgi:hypothetical protein
MKIKIWLVLLAALCLMFTLTACQENDVPSRGTVVEALPEPAEEQASILNNADTSDLLTDDVVDLVSDDGEYDDVERVDLGCCVTNIAVRDTALIGENSITHTNNDFIMTLNSDKLTYRTTEKIRIWGTLEYVGNDDTVTIFSSCPFMIFSIAGGDEIEFGSTLGGAVVDVLVTSVLERGRVYHFDFQKIGGWSADDPNADFWETFFSEEDLLLPIGEYTITLIGGFSLSESIISSESGLRAELNIVVKQ